MMSFWVQKSLIFFSDLFFEGPEVSFKMTPSFDRSSVVNFFPILIPFLSALL